MPAAPSQPLERPFLWQVDARTAGIPPSYLFGVMHIGVDPYQVLPLGIWKKFDAARTLVMEVDTTGPDTLGLGQQPEGRTLAQQVGADAWAKIVQTLDLDADEAEAIAGLLPWMLMIQLSQTLAPEGQSIEDVLQARAVEYGKATAFLESIKVQSDLLARFIDGPYLVAFVGNLAAQKQGLAKQAEIYRSGDEQALYQSAIANMAEDIGTEGMDALMYQRNRTWVEAIEEHVATGGAFVMVGAAHTVGAESVVDLLRRRGYTVTRLRE